MGEMRRAPWPARARTSSGANPAPAAAVPGRERCSPRRSDAARARVPGRSSPRRACRAAKRMAGRERPAVEPHLAAVGGVRSGSTFMSVLLPAPFSPTSARTSPGNTRRLTPSSATVAPKRFGMSRIAGRGERRWLGDGSPWRKPRWSERRRAAAGFGRGCRGIPGVSDAGSRLGVGLIESRSPSRAPIRARRSRSVSTECLARSPSTKRYATPGRRTRSTQPVRIAGGIAPTIRMDDHVLPWARAISSPDVPANPRPARAPVGDLRARRAAAGRPSASRDRVKPRLHARSR